MSTVGLTKAKEKALELVARGRYDLINRPTWVRLREAELAGSDGKLTPRGHAALAAPRMTRFQYEVLCKLERGDEILKREYNQFNAACWKGWVDERGENLSDAGRTALNNVRAAMGSPDWKEGISP